MLTGQRSAMSEERTFSGHDDQDAVSAWQSIDTIIKSGKTSLTGLPHKFYRSC